MLLYFKECAVAIYSAIDDVLVSQDELNLRGSAGQLRRLQTDRNASVEFQHGVARHKARRGQRRAASTSPIAPVPIGLGRPLTVQVRHVYTGDQAHGFWGDKDMLVTSAMKSVAAYDGAPRAVNFLVHKAMQNRNFRAVDATEKGTPLVCYTPALAQSSSVLTVEVVFDGFPAEMFAAIGQAFSAAAGLPVFAPASGYLAAAGIVTKLIGGVGKALSNGTPALKRTEEVTFVTPGSVAAEAGFRLLLADDAPSTLLDHYTLSAEGALVKKADGKTLYDGPETYAVISLDGRENDDFKEFTPAAASAALLDKFYNINDGSSRPVALLQQALSLYNDMIFRDKATAASRKLGKITDKNSAEYKDLQALVEAYLANINASELKPDL
jgi:hypothetical protein